jgi:hypothetical protein
MMKNVLIVFTVLAMASVANATLSISFNGATDLPDSQIFLKPSETAVIGVYAVAEKAVWTNIIVLEGLGSADLTGMSIIALGVDEDYIVDWTNDPDAIGFVKGLGYNPFGIVVSALIHVAGEPMAIPENVPMIDGIKLHCEGYPGDVIVSLLDGADGALLDRMVIHQIPEPITFALLGLGGLFLRRRK